MTKISANNSKITKYFKSSEIEPFFKTGLVGGGNGNQANITRTRPAASGWGGEVHTNLGDGVETCVRTSVRLSLDRVETEDYGGKMSGTDKK